MTSTTTSPADRSHRTGTEHAIGEQPLVSIQHLYVDYMTEDDIVPACQDINLDIGPGEIVGIAGESGSGKSTLLAAMGRLQRQPAVTSGGKVLFHRSAANEDSVSGKKDRASGKDRAAGNGAVTIDLTELSEQQLERLRWDEISIVMQSAMACLNPVARLDAQFVDVIRKHRPSWSKADARRRAAELLDMVGIDTDRLRAYPHELSGGMQQRVLIALALACEPSLILMDEPTTAVDVILQRRILSQLMELQQEFGFAIAFVTHDLSLLMEISDRIAIMYAGKIVEVGTPERLYTRAHHPYTRGLRDAFPPLSEPIRRMSGIPGTPPDLNELPTGCAFEPRCAISQDVCRSAVPELLQIEDDLVACHLAGQKEEISVPADAEDARAPSGDAVEAPAMTEAPAAGYGPVLEVRDLSVVFSGRFGSHPVTAVDSVDLTLDAAEIVALVGESGSGKSTIARVLAGLQKPTSGQVLLRGESIAGRSAKDYSSEVQMIFQDPFNSLNSLKRVSHIIGRALKIHGLAATKAESRERLVAALEKVSLNPVEKFLERFPSEMSGGQRQRVAMARALSVGPKVLLADEPTSMLDASMRLDVLNLLGRLRDTEGVSVLFITHDIASARYLSDRILVMNQGRIVESGPTEDLIDNPKHEYTRRLLDAAPDPAHYKARPHADADASNPSRRKPT